MPAPRSSTVLASSLSASLSLHDALPIFLRSHVFTLFNLVIFLCALGILALGRWLDLLFAIAAVTYVIIGVVQEYSRSEEHTSELQSRGQLVCRLLLEKKKIYKFISYTVS